MLLTRVCVALMVIIPVVEVFVVFASKVDN